MDTINHIQDYFINNRHFRQRFDELSQLVAVGKNNVKNDLTTNRLQIDSKWLSALEDGLEHIENIIANPKNFIVDKQEIVPVEKAKRINSATIRHLAQHTQFISKVDRDDITPKKILTTTMAFELAIYENRFVCTLINFAHKFLSDKADDIIVKSNMQDVHQINYDTVFDYNEDKVDFKIDIKITSKNEDKQMLVKNNEIVAKTKKLLRRIAFIKSSSFYKEVSKAKPIFPPIQRTNLIRTNIDYSACYKLWSFISGFQVDGYTLSVNRKNLPIDDNYLQDMKGAIALHLHSMIENDILKKDEYDKAIGKTVRPQRLKVDQKFDADVDIGGRIEKTSEEVINEYFYSKMKQQLLEDAEKEVSSSGKKYTETKVFKETFKNIYSELEKVSDAIYKEFLMPKEEENKMLHYGESKLKRLQREYAKEREIEKKLELFRWLKQKDMNDLVHQRELQEKRVLRKRRAIILEKDRIEKVKEKEKKRLAKLKLDRELKRIEKEKIQREKEQLKKNSEKLKNNSIAKKSKK